jgi:2Fe-2S ferredoxin
MGKVTFVASDGSEHVVELMNGQSIMEGAKAHGIAGIEAKCGGQCICATCHVYVDDLWLAPAGERSESEEDLLDFTEGVTPNSRLSCQIKMSELLDGLVVRVPPA